MIVDGPITVDLTQGQDRRIPQDGDTQTVVPPSVSPVVLALRNTNFLTQPANPTIVDSTAWDFFQARLNQAASTNAMVTLAPGLWELEMLLTTSFDYVSAPPQVLAGAVAILASVGGVTTRLISRYPAIGTFTDFNRMRVLLRTATLLQSFVPLTGAAQNAAFIIQVNAIRIL